MKRSITLKRIWLFASLFMRPAFLYADVVFNAQEQAIYDGINAYRVQQSQADGITRPRLKPSPKLTETATWMGNDLASRNLSDLTHTDSLNRDLATRLRALGYTGWTHVAEILAAQNNSASNVIAQWKTSKGPDGHDTAMLDPQNTMVGINFINRPGTSFGTYWTVNFGNYDDTVVPPGPGHPPVISELTVNGSAEQNRTFTCPVDLRLRVRVDDPDGLSDIASVRFYTYTSQLITDITTITGNYVEYTWHIENVNGPTSYNISALVIDKSRNGVFSTDTMPDISVHLNPKSTIPAPRITRQPTNQSVQENQTATFSIEGEGSGLIYQWQYASLPNAWLNVDGATSPNLSFTTRLDQDQWKYRCVVERTGGGTVISDPATLTVTAAPMNAPPHVDWIKPRDVTFLTPATIVMEARATDDDGSIQSVEFYNRDKKIDGVVSQDQNIYRLTLANAAVGYYELRAKATDNKGTGSYSSTAYIAVFDPVTPKPHLPEITTQPSDVSAAVGQNATFRLKATSPTRILYSWLIKRPGDSEFTRIRTLRGSDEQTISEVTLSEDGSEVYCELSNDDGKISSRVVKLHVSGLAWNFPRTFPMNGKLVLNYPRETGARFTWTFTDAQTGAPALNAAGSTGTASFSTAAPELSLTGSALGAGTYQLTISIINGQGVQQGSLSGTITLAPTISSTPGAIAYPNPWRADNPAHVSKGGVTFSPVTPGGTLKIFTVSAQLVRKEAITGTSVLWDLKNDSSERAASGVYLYIVENADGSTARGKFVIIR